MGKWPIDRPDPRDFRVEVSAAQPHRIGSDAAALSAAADAMAEYAFLLSDVDEAMLRWAIAESLDSKMPPQQVLILSGQLTVSRYLGLLEAEIERQFPASAGGLTEAVDGLSVPPVTVAAAVAAIRARGNVPLLLSPEQIDWSSRPEWSRAAAEAAANGLRRRWPELSAGSRFATWQLVAAPTAVGLAIGFAAFHLEATLTVIAALVTLPFLLVVGLRALALLIAVAPSWPRSGAPPLADAELPIYSVIVPLFREAEVLPDLVQALNRLDYPPEKLDILLVLESVDVETRAAALALAIPPHMRVIVVPDQQPRTKPKALNFALGVMRGAYVVIYDAEDDPEPDQLRLALAAFRSGPHNLMCVQARLALHNPAPGLLARQFMLEYGALFDALLPALVRLRLPIPLGGTSNHFPRQVLEALGGWDAYNVTEDADLGTRIARLGGRVGVIDSTTFEEAPESFRVWLPQRTRWLKGYMQTWLVHMRHPGGLRAELGISGFLGFHAQIGGIVLSALVHPVFVAFIVYGTATGLLLAAPGSAFAETLMSLALFNLVGGYACGIALAGIAAIRRRRYGLLPHIALMPFYWLLISVAAYRALLQLVTNPYLWEKTPHSARRRQRPMDP